MDDYLETVSFVSKTPGQPQAEEQAKLIVIEGGNTGKSVLLDRAETSIGRRADNHLVLDARGVSRVHGRVVRDGGQYFVEDLGATQSIVRNDETLVPHRRYLLAHGDRLRFSDQIVIFCLTAATGPRRRFESINIDPSKVRADADEFLQKFPELRRP